MCIDSLCHPGLLVLVLRPCVSGSFCVCSSTGRALGCSPHQWVPSELLKVVSLRSLWLALTTFLVCSLRKCLRGKKPLQIAGGDLAGRWREPSVWMWSWSCHFQLEKCCCIAGGSVYFWEILTVLEVLKVPLSGAQAAWQVPWMC